MALPVRMRKQFFYQNSVVHTQDSNTNKHIKGITRSASDSDLNPRHCNAKTI